MVLNIAADELLASLRVNLPAGSDLVMLNATDGSPEGVHWTGSSCWIRRHD